MGRFRDWILKKFGGEKMDSMIHIGTDVKKTLPDLTKSILQILGTNAGDDVKKTALNVLVQAFEVKNTTISNCFFENKK